MRPPVNLFQVFIETELDLTGIDEDHDPLGKQFDEYDEYPTEALELLATDRMYAIASRLRKAADVYRAILLALIVYLDSDDDDDEDGVEWII